jgi:hypothetical protein
MKLTRRASLAGVLVVLAVVLGGCGETEIETRTVAVPLPTPVPSQTPEPVERPLPEATPGSGSVIVSGDPAGDATKSGVTGGGPSDDGSGEVSGGGLAGDAKAVARIQAQLPSFLGYITLDGDQALSVITELVNFVPAFGALSHVTTVTNCAVDYGVVGMRAYLAPDRSHAGAVVVVSHTQIQPGQLATIAAQCFISQVLSGGPGFDPCFTSYSIDNQVDGVNDRYYIFTGATNGQFCDAVRSAHANFNPQPIRL